MLDDVRFAWRVFARNVYSFGLVIVLVGVAVGSTTAVFTVMDALVLHPLAIKDQERVVHLGGLANLSFMDPVSWWGQAQTLDALSTYSAGEVNVEGEGGKKWVRAAMVSYGFFSVFEVRPFVGRGFSKQDEEPGQNRIAVLSHAFWRSYFGGRRSVLGAQLRLNDIPYVVAGVMREGFDFPAATQLWLPRLAGPQIKLPDLVSDSGEMLQLGSSNEWVGRLRPGVSVVQGRSELAALLKRLNEVYTPKTRTVYGQLISVYPLRERLAKNFKPALQALFAGSILVLLVASANCCTFLLGRAAARRKEIAVRQALGASGARILRQTLTEMALLGFASGLLAFVIAIWSLTSIRKVFPLYLVHMPEGSSLTVTAFCASLLLSMVVGLLAGLVVTLQSMSPNSLEALKDYSGPLVSSRGRVLRNLFVAIEVSLAFVLVIGSTLSIKTFLNLTAIDAGFNPRQVITVHLTFPRAQFTRERFLVRQQEILDAAQTVPDISTVGAADVLPVSGPSGGVWVRRRDVYKFCLSSMLAGDYFRALEIPLIAGRSFSETDTDAVIISERMAHEFWQGSSPIGDELRLEGEDRPRQVIGVAKDTRRIDLSDKSELQLYLPYTQPYRGQPSVFSMYLIVRCGLHCVDSASLLIQRVRAAGGGNSIDRFVGLEGLVEAAIAPAKARAVLLSIYAALGLGLALAGVYAFVSYLSVVRNYEMGVRMVFGARPGDVVLLIAGDGILSAAIGVAIGGVASIVAVRVLASLLFGVKPLDPVSFATAAFLLFTGAALASLIPAVRVAWRSPWDVLQAG